jgi:hypothetical protein
MSQTIQRVAENPKSLDLVITKGGQISYSVLHVDDPNVVTGINPRVVATREEVLRAPPWNVTSDEIFTRAAWKDFVLQAASTVVPNG